jgi:hypothetical protein
MVKDRFLMYPRPPVTRQWASTVCQPGGMEPMKAV